MPRGCAFASRCDNCMKVCLEELPEELDINDCHKAACWMNVKGKTTVGRTVLHLYKPTAGEILYDGQRITPQNIHNFRKEMQIVFQDPYSLASAPA